MENNWATLLLTAFGLSWDSFEASLGLGTLAPNRNRTVWIAAVFAIGDGSATWIGAWSGSAIAPYFHPWASWVAFAVVAGTGITVLRKRERDGDSRSTLWRIPIVLSLDNLNVGVALGMLQFRPTTSGLITGLCSGLFSYIGLLLGCSLRERLKWRAIPIGGVLLLLCGIGALAEILVETD